MGWAGPLDIVHYVADTLLQTRCLAVPPILGFNEAVWHAHWYDILLFNLRSLSHGYCCPDHLVGLSQSIQIAQEAKYSALCLDSNTR
jgi:hypothetical protein